jgi:hypothetical protein
MSATFTFNLLINIISAQNTKFHSQCIDLNRMSEVFAYENYTAWVIQKSRLFSFLVIIAFVVLFFFYLLQ